MKVQGKNLNGPRIVKTYLPISDGGAVEFAFRPLRSDEKFATVCPRPKPPVLRKPGGVELHDTNDANYKKLVDDWGDKKFDWEFLRSIDVTVGLEWETVRPEDPASWKLWETEITNAFGENAKEHLIRCFVDAQYITEESVERARATFLTSDPSLSGS